MQRSIDGETIISRRHPEWVENHVRWRWLLDSYEGGERYREATYGTDYRGLPVRNLVRHKREYPDPREMGGVLGNLLLPNASTQDPIFTPSDDDYELRRSRTPVPTFVCEAVETHLSRIYSREVKRTGSSLIREWWSDVDGCGTTIDDWFSETVAPLLLVLGQIDLAFDHPIAPSPAEVRTQADVKRLGLDRCIASVILPENMLWWVLDSTGQYYEECLVRESCDGSDHLKPCFRYWSKTNSSLYDFEGNLISVLPHAFGAVPIVRVFDRRKVRCKHVGRSRYESVAERQREYYNRDSELILSDTTQAHPLLQGPEDYVQSDGTVPIGPSWLLPKKKNSQGGTATYEGFDVVNFPKDAAESLRRNKADIREDVDRDSSLVRPTSISGIAQSGLSKAYDYADGNNRLSKIAQTLARVERVAASFALLVLNEGRVRDSDQDPVEITYPADFDLYTAGDLATLVNDFQTILSNAGKLPTTESLLLARLLRLCLPGLSDEQYQTCDNEIGRFVHTQLGVNASCNSSACLDCVEAKSTSNS